MAFLDSFLLLQQEGYLLRTSLAEGLTLLRAANLDEKGRYYGAFFGLSNGIERLLKAIIVLDHMADHALKAPGNLKKFGGKSGHDLLALLSSARAIRVASSSHPLAALQESTIEYDILSHLNEFAERCGRYANLDALASGQAVPDPLTRWKRITKTILERDVPDATKRIVQREAMRLAADVADSVRVIAHDLDKAPLSMQEWFEVPRLQELASVRAVVNVFWILCPIKHLLAEVNDRAIRESQRVFPKDEGVPFMHEFLDFIQPDERAILRKRRWP